MVANVLPIINLPMALRNLPIAANGLPLVPISNDIMDEGQKQIKNDKSFLMDYHLLYFVIY